MLIVSVVGARPNFIKLAPMAWGLKNYPEIKHFIIHTGQHYDFTLSQVFFNSLDIPEPDINLEVGSESNSIQTARIMERLEPILDKLNPDWVITYGDVNSTLAAALVAAKMKIRTAHVEAGMRSYDRTMPEEINRIVTDVLSDLLFSPTEIELENLLKEGIDQRKIKLVGNIMIDVLARSLPKINYGQFYQTIINKHQARLRGSENAPYIVLTIHRASNTDNPQNVKKWIEIIELLSHRGFVIIFPIHPRTKKSLEVNRLTNRLEQVPNLIIENPFDYLNFISLLRSCFAVITDSGGIQEEATWLNVPCLVLRSNTERIYCLQKGTTELVHLDAQIIDEKIDRIMQGQWKKSVIHPLWDGKTAQRIINSLLAN